MQNKNISMVWGKKELNPKTKMAFLNENNNKKDNNIFFVTFSFYDTD